MSASVSRLLPLLGGLRGTLGGSSGMERRGGGSRFAGAALLLLDRRFDGAAALSLAPLDISIFFLHCGVRQLLLQLLNAEVPREKIFLFG